MISITATMLAVQSTAFWVILVILIQISFNSSAEASLYAESPFVDELLPYDIYELQRDDYEGVCIVQYYNGSDPNSDDFVSNYSIAAKSMVGYARSTAINVEKHPFIHLVMQMSQTPTYVYYGYYKHLPDTVTTLVTVDDLHEETSKQLVRFFEERSVYRFIYDKHNMEMGIGDLDFRLMQSKAPWIIVYFKRDLPSTSEIAEVWTDLVHMFHERIQFGSVNNPLYNALTIADEEYPVVKFFPKGNKQEKKPETYIGELTTEGLAEYLDGKIMSSKVIPHRITAAQVVEPCLKKKFCIFLFVPRTLDYQLKTVDMLTRECSKHGRRAWAWYWNEYNDQPEIEAALDVTEEGAPNGTMIVLNVHAATFMRRIFEEEITEAILERIVQDIQDDVGFDQHITTRELPDIKRINVEVSREEL